MNYKQLLKSKKSKIAVWGTGYIGLSTMVYFSKKKIKCVGYDVDSSKIKKINSGVLPSKMAKNSVRIVVGSLYFIYSQNNRTNRNLAK